MSETTIVTVFVIDGGRSDIFLPGDRALTTAVKNDQSNSGKRCSCSDVLINNIIWLQTHALITQILHHRQQARQFRNNCRRLIETFAKCLLILWLALDKVWGACSDRNYFPTEHPGS